MSRSFPRVIAAAGIALWLAGTASPVTAAPGDARDRAGVAFEAQAVPTSSPIVLDGRFDESVWRDAPVIGEFVQRQPSEGAAPPAK